MLVLRLHVVTARIIDNYNYSLQLLDSGSGKILILICTEVLIFETFGGAQLNWARWVNP
jgi:hypothetical protein